MRIWFRWLRFIGDDVISALCSWERLAAHGWETSASEIYYLK